MVRVEDEKELAKKFEVVSQETRFLFTKDYALCSVESRRHPKCYLYV
jgi:hypothetical protein